ncbi:hypothetical protein ABZZ20_01660 [Streptomyces sp. NPDC006430]|uniref:hypothetical protein n=1 Tax=Streptomyces sp. NPDC006430 TaxID=3154299 RepID=UPI0033A9C89D
MNEAGKQEIAAWERAMSARNRRADPAADRSPADRSPAERSPAPPADGLPAARPEQPGGVTQIHEPGALPVDPEVPDRERCWSLLPADVRSRTLEKAGTVLVWWARLTPDGRPFAVLLGDRGLCRVDPAPRGAELGYRGERTRVEPGSLRHRSFDGGSPKPGTSTGPGPGPSGVRVERLVLDPPEAQGVIGHFPLDVQDFLQRPFLAGGRNVTADWYYYETAETRHTALFVTLVLSTDRHVTAIEADRTLDRGATPDRARWHSIRCHQARFLPR